MFMNYFDVCCFCTCYSMCSNFLSLIYLCVVCFIMCDVVTIVSLSLQSYVFQRLFRVGKEEVVMRVCKSCMQIEPVVCTFWRSGTNLSRHTHTQLGILRTVSFYGEGSWCSEQGDFEEQAETASLLLLEA